MKKLDKYKVIGYQLEYDMYTGYYIEPFTVYDFVWWYNHNNGKRSYGGINWKRDLILVSEEAYNEYLKVCEIRAASQATLRKLKCQYDLKYAAEMRKYANNN